MTSPFAASSAKNSHILTVRTRRESDRKYAECSCGQWHMRNALIADIRDAHGIHVQSELGPEAECTFPILHEESGRMRPCGRSAASHCLNLLGCMCGGIHLHPFSRKREATNG